MKSVWRATVLIPYNPAVIFEKLSVHANKSSKNLAGASSGTPIQMRFFSGVIPPTSENVKQITEVEDLVSLFRHQTLDLPKLTLLHKTLKAARLAMADKVVLNRTNTELLAANTRKKRQVQHTKIQYDGQSARVSSLEDVEERRQVAENKRKDKEARKLAQKEKQYSRYFLQVSKNLMRLGLDLIYGPKPLTSSKNTNPPVLQLGIKTGGSGLDKCLSRPSSDWTRCL